MKIREMEKKMNSLKTRDELNNLLNDAYRCKPGNLDAMLQKIELEIKNSHSVDNILLRAKMIVTSKMALINSK